MSKKFAIVLLVTVALIASASAFAYQAAERNAPVAPPAKDKPESKAVPHPAGNIYFGNPRTDLRGPLSEDFEGGAIPANWTVINNDGGSYQWEAYNFGASAHSGTYIARCHYETSILLNDDWLITP